LLLSGTGSGEQSRTSPPRIVGREFTRLDILHHHDRRWRGPHDDPLIGGHGTPLNAISDERDLGRFGNAGPPRNRSAMVST
jgi:hypothetical protein